MESGAIWATEFTPFLSLFGGALIGVAALILMMTLGRVFGATGILGGALTPVDGADLRWRIAAIAGMISAPLLIFLMTGGMPTVTVPISLPMILIGGFLVGVGVTYGNGCPSGHGVCGIARLSGRSIAATLSFMVTAVLTVYLLRHVLGG